VLVVDDDPFNRDVLQQELEALGHDVLLAAGGREGLAAIAERDVDVVLLDIMMPGVSGFDVLQKLRAEPATRELPVIVVSALHDVQNIVRGITLGADDYLPKPFEPVILEARIAQALRVRRWRRQERDYLAAVERERARADELLDAILPHAAVEELKSTGHVAPRWCADVAVMFVDVREASRKAIALAPDILIEKLDSFVDAADRAASAHGLERIKVVGDAVIVTGNLLEPHPRPVDACIDCAFDIFRGAPDGWQLRGGLAFGAVTAGVVGRARFAFDIWGPVVNTAARLAAIKDVDAVFLDPSAAARTARALTAPDAIELKGLGLTEVFALRRPTT
jgi:CheY-like chemotaxis protein/class 3 adenylate cyclase